MCAGSGRLGGMEEEQMQGGKDRRVAASNAPKQSTFPRQQLKGTLGWRGPVDSVWEPGFLVAWRLSWRAA